MNSKKKYHKPLLKSEEMYVETKEAACTKRDCSTQQAGPCGVPPNCTPKS